MAPLASAEELATYLNQEINTAQAELVLELASDAVRQVAGQQIDFARTTFTAYPQGIYLRLPQRPIILDEQNPIVVSGFADATYRLNSEWGTLTRVAGGRWPESVVVTYSHGFPAGDVPASLRKVVLDAAARTMSNPEGLASYSVGGVAAVWKGSGNESFGMLTEPERRLIRRFFGGSMTMTSIA